MAKKNPYVMTIGFKKDDPEHILVAELLNGMGRGKAQYIVKAILVYQNMQLQRGTVSYGLLGIDYRSLKEMILQILEEREERKAHDSSARNYKEKNMQESNLLEEFNENDLNGIIESLELFQGV